LLDGGGVAFGAWDGGSLAGFGSLDTRGVGGRSNVLELDMLYVSKDYRGRGIGRGLTALLMEEARSRGASALYVSATPSRKTVDAYLAMGAEPLKAADPELFRREPEDVHLIMRLPAP
jgi:predicted N-acetyltransferase YhbS